MITTIIFDIGNVLVDFNWKTYIEGFHFTEEITQRLFDATVLSDAWNEFDRGAMEDEAMIQLFVNNDPELEKEIRMICEDVHDILDIREYAIPWVKHFKEQGYKVLYLSNFSKKAERECPHALTFISYMDGGIMSYQIKCIKPQPEIYQRLIEEYELIPGECVFLDDREENCVAARQQGMYAIVFEGKQKAEEELAKLGVRV